MVPDLAVPVSPRGDVGKVEIIIQDSQSKREAVAEAHPQTA
jgi:hypothetical protein